MKNTCTDRCEPGEADNYTITYGAVRHRLGCIPTDAAYVRVKYYGWGDNNAFGPGQAYCPHLVAMGNSPDNLIYEDLTNYTGNQFIVWDTVAPSINQMECGPHQFSGSNGNKYKYRYNMTVTAYGSNNIPLSDQNYEICDVDAFRTFWVSCECEMGQGLNGYECTNSGCLPASPASTAVGIFPNLWSCTVGGFTQGSVYYSACITGPTIWGCKDTHANNYNGSATHHDPMLCTYDPLPCEHSVINDYEFTVTGEGLIPWVEDITSTYTEAISSDTDWQDAFQLVLDTHPPAFSGQDPAWRSYGFSAGAPAGNLQATSIFPSSQANPHQLIMGSKGTTNTAYNWATGIYIMLGPDTEFTPSIYDKYYSGGEYQIEVKVSMTPGLFDPDGCGMCADGGNNGPCNAPNNGAHTKGRLQIMTGVWLDPNGGNIYSVGGGGPNYQNGISATSFDIDLTTFNYSTGETYYLEWTAMPSLSPGFQVEELLVLQLDGYCQQRIYIDSVCVRCIGGTCIP